MEIHKFAMDGILSPQPVHILKPLLLPLTPLQLFLIFIHLSGRRRPTLAGKPSSLFFLILSSSPSSSFFFFLLLLSSSFSFSSFFFLPSSFHLSVTDHLPLNLAAATSLHLLAPQTHAADRLPPRNSDPASPPRAARTRARHVCTRARHNVRCACCCCCHRPAPHCSPAAATLTSPPLRSNRRHLPTPPRASNPHHRPAAASQLRPIACLPPPMPPPSAAYACRRRIHTCVPAAAPHIQSRRHQGSGLPLTSASPAAWCTQSASCWWQFC